MTAVSVLVPYGRADPHRDAAWTYARAWWAAIPGWEVITGAGPDDGPWCKAAAVADALTRAAGDVLVVADADVIPDRSHLYAAVSYVTAGVSGWAAPHRTVVRLNEAGTALVYAGGPLPDPPRSRPHTRFRSAHVEQVHTATRGGGVVVLPRALYERVPLDARFRGWGQEDASWGHALRVVAGDPHLGHTHLWHLWHPPQARYSRRVGSLPGLALHHRYLNAVTAGAIEAILSEAGARAGSVPA